jgi:phage terminase Nu1 subunit (DNA packaging protein)
MPQSYPVSAIAQLLKVSDRRVQQLAKDGIIPRPVNGEYDAIPCVQGYVDYLRKIASGSGSLSLTDERTRLTRLQADIADITLRKARGEVIVTRAAMRLWGEIITSSRQRLLGLATRLAPELVNIANIPEIKDKIERAIYEILTDFSNPNLVEHARAESDSIGFESLPTAPKAHRKRVGRSKKKTEPRVKRRTGPVENGPG